MRFSDIERWYKQRKASEKIKKAASLQKIADNNEREIGKCELKYERQLAKLEKQYQQKKKNLGRKLEWKKVYKYAVREKVCKFRNKAASLAQKYARISRADSEWYVIGITCWTRMKWDQCDGGHYRPKSDRTIFDFDQLNIWPQSNSDNSIAPRWGKGETVKYREALIRKIWEEKVKEIDSAPRRHKRTREDYEKIIAEYTELIAIEYKRGEKEWRIW